MALPVHTNAHNELTLMQPATKSPCPIQANTNAIRGAKRFAK